MNRYCEVKKETEKKNYDAVLQFEFIVNSKYHFCPTSFLGLFTMTFYETMFNE